MILRKFRIVAEVVGVLAIGYLTVYGAFMTLRNTKSVFASTVAASTNEQSSVFSPQIATAANISVPSLINYQGTLRDSEHKPLSGAYTMTLRIYSEVTGPTSSALYTGTFANVTVRDGHFSILLGDPPNPTLPATLFSNPNRFIGVTVAGYDELAPRQRFASVPYTIQADHAFALGGENATPYTAVWMDQGKVRIGNKEAFNPTISANDTAQVTIDNLANDQWGLLVTSSGGGSTKGLKIKTAFQEHAHIPLLQANAGFGTNEFQRFIVEANGNVGIGSHQPETKLDIRGDGAPQVRIGDSAGYWQIWAGGSLHIRDESTDRLVIGNNGNVTIGGNLEASNLRVNGTIDYPKFQLSTEQNISAFGAAHHPDPIPLAPTDRNFCFLTAVSMRVDNTGNQLSACKVSQSQGSWWLEAETGTEADNNDISCSAMCFAY